MMYDLEARNPIVRQEALGISVGFSIEGSTLPLLQYQGSHVKPGKNPCLACLEARGPRQTGSQKETEKRVPVEGSASELFQRLFFRRERVLAAPTS